MGDTNGGSNNINLHWQVPGRDGELVPRQYLSDEPGDAGMPAAAAERTANVTIIRRD